MTALTIRVELKVGRRYRVSLWPGRPDEHADGCLAEVTRSGLTFKKYRQGVIDKTGDAETIGAKLGGFLLGGEVGIAWRKRVAEITTAESGENLKQPSLSKPTPIHTYLDVRVRALIPIPWELARSSKATLFLKERLPFVRFQAAKPSQFSPELELRVLAINAARDNEEIGGQREIREIRRVLRPMNRIIDLTTMKWPSRRALKDKIEEYRPHVLHIIGHGNKDGLLLYDGNDLRVWGPVEIDIDFGSLKWQPELAYLNSCRSATGNLDSKGQTGQWTVVEQLLQNGLAAVIAMHSDVRGSLAGIGAAAFYGAIAEGAPIDVAIARCRHEIARDPLGGEAGLEPYLPQLTVTKPVDEILRHTAKTAIDDCPELNTTLKTFVNRDTERRKLLSTLDAGKPAVLISGAAHVGKSSLLRWCVAAWLHRGIEVRYVQLNGCRTWLDVLRAIRDGENGRRGSIHRGLGPQARALLNWRLNALSRGIADPPRDSFRGTEQEDTATEVLLEPQRAIVDAHIKAMNALHDSLQKEAGDGTLIVVLDNFDANDRGLPGAYFSVLREHWINNLVIRSGSNVRVALGVKNSQLAEYRLESLPDGFTNITVDYFTSEEFCDLMVELLPLHFHNEVGDKREKFLQWLIKELKDYSPAAGQPLDGVALLRHCRTIWEYGSNKRRAWENSP